MLVNMLSIVSQLEKSNYIPQRLNAGRVRYAIP